MNYKESIISTNNTVCYLCGSTRWIEIHHIFAGSDRKLSTKYGLVVPLCHECHQGKNGVHQNFEKRRYLQQIAQKRFEEEYPEEEWMKIFRRNYL